MKKIDNSYCYDNAVNQVLKFLIPENKQILYYGSNYENTLLSLKSSLAVWITENEIFTKPNRDNTSIVLINSRFQDYIPAKVFDYIVLDDVLQKTEDICLLLKNLSKACTNHTRIIIRQENYFWQRLLKKASLYGLKNKGKTKNRLSVNDINTYLKAAGFESTRTFYKTLCQMKFRFIGIVINYIFSIVPFLDFLKLDQFIVARLTFKKTTSDNYSTSLTICITVRDEEENIEPIISSLPTLCKEQEILFIEGHSKDNTVKEISRMIALFPQKNIRLLHQPGEGQGDAIRTGFKVARGDIIILYEGDGTSDPSDIRYFYEAIQNNQFEFIEGNRFGYPMRTKSMPFLNKIGNIFFAKWFSLFLNQRVTDTLSGIKAIQKLDYEKIYDSWGFIGVADPFGDFELLYGSARYGLKIGEIPIHYKPRTSGVSKTNVFRHGSDLFKLIWNGYFIFRNFNQLTKKII